MKHKQKFFFKAGISLLLIAFLSTQVDWKIILESLSETSIPLFLLSTFLVLVSELVLTVKYFILISGTSLSRPFISLFLINLKTRFYALFLPSALSTGAVRWYKVTKASDKKIFFLASTVLERTSFLLLLIIFGMAPLLFYRVGPLATFKQQIMLPALILFLAGSGILAYFLIPPFQRVIISIIRALSASLLNRNLDEKVVRFAEHFHLEETSYKKIGLIFLLSSAWQLIYIAWMTLLVYAISVDMKIIDIAWISSLVLLLQVLPISLAGLGVREGAFAYLFMLFGLPGEYGILVGILFYVQVVIGAVVGGTIELAEK